MGNEQSRFLIVKRLKSVCWWEKSYLGRTCLTSTRIPTTHIKQPGVVAHVCNPSTGGTEGGDQWLSGLAGHPYNITQLASGKPQEGTVSEKKVKDDFRETALGCHSVCIFLKNVFYSFNNTMRFQERVQCCLGEWRLSWTCI